MKAKQVKLSAIDGRVPATAEVVFVVTGGMVGRRPPRVILQTINLDEAQAMCDKMALRHEVNNCHTIWHDKETKRKLNKLNILRSGTTRRFIVTVPWSAEVSKGRMEVEIKEAVEKCPIIDLGAKVQVRALAENEGVTRKPDKDFLVVPVLEKFDHTKPIGELTILHAALPPTSEFTFALGVRALTLEGTTKRMIGEYELVCVSPVHDTSYAEYLNLKEQK